jgi:hypothetical protein
MHGLVVVANHHHTVGCSTACAGSVTACHMAYDNVKHMPATRTLHAVLTNCCTACVVQLPAGTTSIGCCVHCTASALPLWQQALHTMHIRHACQWQVLTHVDALLAWRPIVQEGCPHNDKWQL